MPSRRRQRQQFLDTTPWRDATLRALDQDASSRHYFRLSGGPEPALLMDAPPDREPISPFVDIARHLLALGFSAPAIYHLDSGAGFIVLEDFGEQIFTRLLAKNHDELSLYLLATDCLVALHGHPRATEIALPRRETTLLEEALLLCDWFYPLLTGNTCPAPARRQFANAWQAVLSQRITSADVLVLRDFHVDNAMLLGGRDSVRRCGLLDFQDAAIGPAGYDLMSLLEDARRDVAPAVFDACWQRYLATSGVVGEVDDFATDCAILAAQRHARVAGIFARLCRRDGKTCYLRHLPRVTRLLARRLDHPALATVQSWFARHCPQFDDPVAIGDACRKVRGRDRGDHGATSHAALHPLRQRLVDGENNPLALDCAYSLKTSTVGDLIDAIKRMHGPSVYLLPISGASAGGGIFQVEKPDDGEVVGLWLAPTSRPRIGRTEGVDITSVALDDILIDTRHWRVLAGGAITLDQLNRALADTLGSRYKVLGADLTSYTYAQVGATFMTGGMGPQRRYFSDSVDEIALYDGTRTLAIKGPALAGYAGTYGWSGLVSAVGCRYCELPAVETAFAIPVDSTAASLARLLQHFSPYANLQIATGKVLSASGATDLVLGLEHVTLASMRPFLRGGDTPLTRRAGQLRRKCEAAGADGLVFVNGYSDLPVDEFLSKLLDDPESEPYTIAGIDLEHTEVFNDPEQMRALREAIPFAARTQAPHGRWVYKGHTDANIRLHPTRVESTMVRLWRANQIYVDAVRNHFDATSGLRGEILVYGHLNPVGVDPHNRITFACDDETVYRQARTVIHAHRDTFFRALRALCDNTGSVFVGGEKSAASECEIFGAFGGPNQAPAALREKFKRQSAAVCAAAPLFNWRALAPYNTESAHSRSSDRVCVG